MLYTATIGFDVERFQSPVDDELLCAICKGVFLDPVIAPCEHVFCSSCINEWLERQNTCPIDRKEIRPPMTFEANDWSFGGPPPPRRPARLVLLN